MAGFFNTLERQSQAAGSQELPDFLSTHPNPGDRNVTVAKLATEWKQQLNLTNPEVNRNEYLKRIEGLIYGEDPKQGFLEDNVFYHPELKFQFPVPANWNYQNTPQSVQMAPKDGKAMMMLTLAPGTSPRQAAEAFVQQYQLQVKESRELSVNGLPAMAIVADQRNQQTGAVIRTMSYFIQHGGNIYLILGASGLNDFNNYSAAFNSTMQNFRTLTDASKINKKPQRIRIKTVAANTTLEQALRSFNMPTAKMQELSILNGMNLNQQVTKGMLIKVIGE